MEIKELIKYRNGINLMSLMSSLLMLLIEKTTSNLVITCFAIVLAFINLCIAIFINLKVSWKIMKIKKDWK